jgi:hypothetical protein
MHFISITSNNASVNDIVLSTVSLAFFWLNTGYHLLPTHTFYTCHVVNLVVQAILASLREADDPDKVDYYTFNKDQPFHLDIDADPDQIELDSEEFQDEPEKDDEMASGGNIMLEEEEKSKATKSLLSKVYMSTMKCIRILTFMLVMLHYHENCFVTTAKEEVSELCNLNISEKECRE